MTHENKKVVKESLEKSRGFGLRSKKFGDGMTMFRVKLHQKRMF